MEFQIRELPPDIVEQYTKKTDQFITPNPDKELNRIYVVSNITEIMGLRAETDWSAEAPDIPKAQRRLGIQNPVYTELLELLTKYLAKPEKTQYIKIQNWLLTYLKQINRQELLDTTKLAYTKNYTVDIRHADTITDCMNYLINYGHQNLSDSWTSK